MPLIRFGLLGLLLWRTAVAFARLRRRLVGEPVRWRRRELVVDVSRGKSDVERVCVGIRVPDRLRFVLRREGAFDALGKWLHLAEEFQTGDSRFDDKVFVVSEDDPLRLALRDDRELRAIAGAMLEDPQVSSIRCNEGLLWVECTSDLARSVDDLTAVEPVARSHLENLDALAARLAAASAPAWDDARDRAARWEQGVYVVCLALGIGGIVWFLLSSVPGPPQPLSYEHVEQVAALAAVASACVLGATAVFRLFGTPRLHLVLLEIVLAAGPGAWFWARSVLAEYNMHGLQGSPRSVLVHIDDREIVYGRRRSHSYYLTLSGWPDPEFDGRLQVSSYLYSLSERYDCLSVRYFPGRLGDPWIAEPVPSDCSSPPP